MITADALHTQRAHAEYLHDRGAGFVFTVKQNQPGLFAALDALPWSQTPIALRDIDTGHGRITTRTIQVLPAPADLPFPHVNQVWLIERYTRDPTGTWRASHPPDSGPNKVRPGMEDAECQNGAGSSARNTAMKQ